MSRLKLIQRIYYNYITKDKIKYARKLGVTVGERCKFMVDPVKCFGTEPWLISIGNHVEITSGVEFLTHEGAIWVLRELDPELKDADKFGRIVIGDNVIIGVDSLIMPGVTVGSNVIIGAHSVVTKDIPNNSVVVGSPARVISPIEKYYQKVKGDCVPTKNMSQEEKRQFLLTNMPSLFS